MTIALLLEHIRAGRRIIRTMTTGGSRLPTREQTDQEAEVPNQVRRRTMTETKAKTEADPKATITEAEEVPIEEEVAPPEAEEKESKTMITVTKRIMDTVKSACHLCIPIKIAQPMTS